MKLSGIGQSKTLQIFIMIMRLSINKQTPPVGGSA
jgi:hypothetical protein